MFEVLGIIFLLAVLILWFPYIKSSQKFGAPFVPTETGLVERVMELGKVKKGDVFYELGSGDGRMIIAAALRGAKAYGVEIDRLRVWYSRAWLWFLRLKNAQIIKKDFFKTDLSMADIVFLFLLPETMEKIKPKLKKELKPGARIVSYGFTFKDWEPVKIDSHKGLYGFLYLYKK